MIGAAYAETPSFVAVRAQAFISRAMFDPAVCALKIGAPLAGY